MTPDEVDQEWWKNIVKFGWLWLTKNSCGKPNELENIIKPYYTYDVTFEL